MPSSLAVNPARSRAVFAVLALLALSAPALSAQSSTHPQVCAEGVRKYAAMSEVPTPHDSLVMPPGEPIRISSAEEERQAELEMLKRAASVGATGIVVAEEVEDDGGVRRVRRRVVPVFVASDTARAYGACRKSG